MFSEHLKCFYGLNVVDFDAKVGIQDPSCAYRIRLDYDDADSGVEWSDRLKAFCQDPNARQVRALVVGMWGEVWDEIDSGVVIRALVEAREQLPSLEALFIGDLIVEECEVSWMYQSSMEPLWEAFPKLREFRVRGGNDLSLGKLQLSGLQTLAVETGGLPANILEEVWKSNLPELEHLELWLGDDGYGWGSSIDDLRPILHGDLFPKLRYLGLRDFCHADDLAKALADAPVLDRIETLDLSLGTLGDEGAEALAASPKVAKLKKLDIHHHFVSDAGLAKLQALGIELNAEDRQNEEKYGDEVWRFVAVGE